MLIQNEGAAKSPSCSKEGSASLRTLLLKRSLEGIPAGISICLLISLLLSSSQTEFFYAAEELIERMNGNVLAACYVQFFVSALIGLVFGAASVIWKKESWSLSFRTGLYLLVTGPAMLLAGWICGWTGGSLKGLLIFVLIFLAVFILIWLAGFLANWMTIRRLNRSLEEKRMADKS